MNFLHMPKSKIKKLKLEKKLKYLSFFVCSLLIPQQYKNQQESAADIQWKSFQIHINYQPSGMEYSI